MATLTRIHVRVPTTEETVAAQPQMKHKYVQMCCFSITSLTFVLNSDGVVVLLLSTEKTTRAPKKSSMSKATGAPVVNGAKHVDGK